MEEVEDGIIVSVRLPFNSRITDIFQVSDLNTLIEEKTQIENPALANSGFRFDEVLFMDINFHQLNLTRGSSYFPLPDQLANKRAIINPKKKRDKECFKWAIICSLTS